MKHLRQHSDFTMVELFMIAVILFSLATLFA